MSNGLFNWKQDQDTIDQAQKTKIPTRRPAYKDYSESYTVNRALTKGTFFNTYPGLKLAAGIMYSMITIPVSFMGIPFVRPQDENDETTGDILKQDTQDMISEFKAIHIESHREGTLFVYPKFNRKTMQIEDEFITDDVVSDIIKDPDTQEILEILTDEEMNIRISRDKTVIVRRKRSFTRSRITVEYEGNVIPDRFKNKTMRNPIGMMPIVFSNIPDSDEVRGHPEVERYLPVLKMYHDVSLEDAKMLSKFSPKMIQTVDAPTTWLDNNGVDADFGNFDIANTDIILNTKEETTTFEFPKDGTQNSDVALRRYYKQLVEMGPLPEIVLGLKTQGNANTAAEQMATLSKVIHDMQVQANDPYIQLFIARLRLHGIVNNTQYSEKLVVEWNELSSVSEEVKSIIFKNFADAISKIMNTAGMTEKQLYNTWQQWFPNSTDEDFDKFKEGINLMASHKQFTNASFEDAQLYKGGDEGQPPEDAD